MTTHMGTDKSVAIGYVHALVFDGPAPDLDTIRRIAYSGDAGVYKNRLTDYAVSAAAGLWVDEYVLTPSAICLGTGTPPVGTTEPLSSDEALWQADNTTLKVCDVKAVFMTVYSEYAVTYSTGEANDVDYTEAGLFDADGNLWAHVKLNLRKSATQTAVVLWKVMHQGI